MHESMRDWMINGLPFAMAICCTTNYEIILVMLMTIAFIIVILLLYHENYHRMSYDEENGINARRKLCSGLRAGMMWMNEMDTLLCIGMWTEYHSKVSKWNKWTFSPSLYNILLVSKYTTAFMLRTEGPLFTEEYCFRGKKYSCTSLLLKEV